MAGKLLYQNATQTWEAKYKMEREASLTMLGCFLPTR